MTTPISLRARCFLPSLLVLALIPLGHAAPQDAGIILVEEGDILPNGWEVYAIGDSVGIDAGGRWIAMVETTEPGSESDTVIMADGQLLMAEGDVLPDGSTLRFLSGLDLDQDGTVGLVYRTELAGTGVSERRLQLGPYIALRQGDPIASPALPAGSTFSTFKAVDLALPYALLVADVQTPGSGKLDVAVLLDFSAGGISAAPAITLVAFEGATPPALPGPISSVSYRGDVTQDGDYVQPVTCDVGGVQNHAIASNTGWLAIPGTPSPAAGAVWFGTSRVNAQVSPTGRRILTGELDVSGAVRGLLASQPGGVIAQESEMFPLLPNLQVSGFSQAPCVLSDTGELAYVVPISTFGDLLVYGNEILLRQDVSTVSGRVVTDLTPMQNNMAIGRGGEAILLTCQHANSQSSLVLVERSIGTTSGCTVVANSTGSEGRLQGEGSSYISANQVHITAGRLPLNSFGYLLASQTESFVAMPGGSSGNLCLGGQIGRFIGQVQSSGSQGTIGTTVDLTAIPQPNGAVAAQPLSTWAFQLWHRDSSGAGTPTSNFTEGLLLTVR